MCPCKCKCDSKCAWIVAIARNHDRGRLIKCVRTHRHKVSRVPIRFCKLNCWRMRIKRKILSFSNSRCIFISFKCLKRETSSSNWKLNWVDALCPEIRVRAFNANAFHLVCNFANILGRALLFLQGNKIWEKASARWLVDRIVSYAHTKLGPRNYMAPV